MGKKMILRLWLVVLFFGGNTVVFSQDEKNNPGNGLNEIMRSNNKIYVVMAVCITILIGLILYLVRIDRKVSRSEKAGFL